MKLYTGSGVEIRMDERVFRLFAALNAAGYSDESEHQGPPLNAPVYHPLRVDVRDKLREVRDEPVTQEVAKLFQENQYPIEDYLAALLAGPDTKLSGNAKKLQPKLAVLDKFAEQAALKALFDELAERQRSQAKELMKVVEDDLEKAADQLDDPEFRAPRNLVVVPNPLDSHDALRTVDVGDERFVVVGPGLESGRDQIVQAVVRPYLVTAVDKAWAAATKYQTHWDGVRKSTRIRNRYGDGKNYLVEALARSLTHRVRHGSSSESDEDFVDLQARENMRWARIALRVWDKHEDGEPFAQALPGLVRKHGP